LGIDFDVIKGKGPAIATPLRSMEQVRGSAGPKYGKAGDGRSTMV